MPALSGNVTMMSPSGGIMLPYGTTFDKTPNIWSEPDQPSTSWSEPSGPSTAWSSPADPSTNWSSG